jgi:hypothetical protein
MAHSTTKVAVVLALIFLAVVGTSMWLVNSVSSEAEVVTVDQNYGPSTAQVALTVVEPAPASPEAGSGG